jgi:hypothetical protein
MRHTFQRLIGSIIIGTSCLSGGAKLEVRDGHPILDGVYVNGHGPYRFLVDTGTNVDLIEAHLAESIGLMTTFRTELASAAGVTTAPGSDGNEVALGSVKVDRQVFLFLTLDAIRHRWPDVQGVLGEQFLSRFDYTIDLRNRRIEFGKQDEAGIRGRLMMINGRPAVPTSLGDLVLDSGADRLTLFGVRPDAESYGRSELRTVAGSQRIGMVFAKPLVIDGRKIWEGDALALPSRREPGVDGLLPLSLFRSVYVCNSDGYVIFH